MGKPRRCFNCDVRLVDEHSQVMSMVSMEPEDYSWLSSKDEIAVFTFCAACWDVICEKFANPHPSYDNSTCVCCGVPTEKNWWFNGVYKTAETQDRVLWITCSDCVKTIMSAIALGNATGH